MIYYNGKESGTKFVFLRLCNNFYSVDSKQRFWKKFVFLESKIYLFAHIWEKQTVIAVGLSQYLVLARKKFSGWTEMENQKQSLT